MSNPLRGEVTLKLGQHEFTLLPSWGAIMAIEHALDTNLLPLARKVARSDVGLTQCATIAHYAAKDHWDGQLGQSSIDGWAKLIQENGGILNESMIEALIQLLENALNGGMTPGKDPAPDQASA